MTVHVLPFWHKPMPAGERVSTTMRLGVFRMLSPFVLGPVATYDGLVSRNMENAWQFSKVYKGQLIGGEIPPAWFKWRDMGWADRKAHRYPMGRGAVPQFSWWDGERLGYVEARKRIYAPVYAKAVEDTVAFDMLNNLYQRGDDLVLLDYDAYDHHALGMHLTEVIDDPKRKMGHAFVLAMMLEGSLSWCLEPRSPEQPRLTP